MKGGWVKRRKHDDGGWVAWCLLCGKKFKRNFPPAKHDDPQRAASDWIGEHLESRAHAAATEAYRAPAEEAPVSPEEKLLREIFGEVHEDKTPEENRRSAARRAAEAATKGDA